MNTSIDEVYDLLADSYLSEQHSTTKFLYLIQDKPLTDLVASVRKHNKLPLGFLEVLVVGAGPTGNSRQTTSGEIPGARDIPKDEALDYDKITYLDISKRTLEYLRGSHAETIFSCGGMYVPGRFVIGNALELSQMFLEYSFDIILAGMCDHIDSQEKFYSEAMKVLGKNGALITTYPAKELNTVIREEIYNISSDQTRFIIKGREYKLPSKIVTNKELKEMYLDSGFDHITTKNIYFKRSQVEKDPFLKSQDCKPSETVLKAAKMLKKRLDRIPILVGGIGFKK